MATLKKYDLTGKETGEVEAQDFLVNAQASSQMIKDYIVALRKNARQWSASTQTRGEVNHSKQKPHAQKGTGRARQGRLSSPQYKGGGCVFGPRPKFDQHVRINKKERRGVIRTLFGEMAREGKLHVIESTALDAPKTKTVAKFLQTLQLSGRVLFLGEGNYAKVEGEMNTKVSVRSEQHKNFAKSVANLPKIEFGLVSNVSGYHVMLAHNIVMTEAAFEELNQWLKIESSR